MLENVLFVLYSKNRHERLALCHHSSDFSVWYTFVLTFNFITQLVGMQGLVFPRRRITSLRY